MICLTMTSFSDKMLISNRCLRDLMPNLIKKSVTVSKGQLTSKGLIDVIILTKIPTKFFKAPKKRSDQKNKGILYY